MGRGEEEWGDEAISEAGFSGGEGEAGIGAGAGGVGEFVLEGGEECDDDGVALLHGICAVVGGVCDFGGES